MRKISAWARRHPWQARACIILLYFPLNVAGLVTGDLLFDLGLQLPGSFLLAAMALFAVTAYYYPQKHALNQLSKEAIYLRRKTCDLLFIVSTFLMISFTGNQANIAAPFYPLATKIAGITPSSHFTIAKPGSTVASGNPGTKKLTRKEVRKTLRHFVQEYRKLYKKGAQGEKIALIALTIIGALLVFFLLVGLSCNIACGGAEALAYILFFGGTFAIVFFAVRLIKRISRSHPGYSKNTPPVSAAGKGSLLRHSAE